MVRPCSDEHRYSQKVRTSNVWEIIIFRVSWVGRSVVIGGYQPVQTNNNEVNTKKSMPPSFVSAWKAISTSFYKCRDYIMRHSTRHSIISMMMIGFGFVIQLVSVWTMNQELQYRRVFSSRAIRKSSTPQKWWNWVPWPTRQRAKQ